MPFPTPSCLFRPASLQWMALFLLAGGTGSVLHAVGIPAGLLLGPMLIAVIFGMIGAKIRVHRRLFRVGQSCVGLLVAQAITEPVLAAMAQSWLVLLFATVTTVGLSTLVAFAAVRFGGLPGSSAAWGSSPGAASAMVSMAEGDGADIKLVATMQYIRVVLVVVIASAVTHFIAPTTAVPNVAPAPAIEHSELFTDYLLVAALILVGLLSGSRIPAGALLVPLVVGSTLQLYGVSHVYTPDWLLTFAYGIIGCYVGLRFDQATVTYVWKRLPTILLSTVLLILLCAVCAWPFAYAADTDFLSMYLATSPGGLDAMAIIALETDSDASLVLATQTMRLFWVILTGAFSARLVIRLSQRRSTHDAR